MNFSEWLSLLESAAYNPYAFHAVILAGGPGSGKSFVARHMLAGLGFKFANSDDIMEIIAMNRKEEYLLGVTAGDPGYDAKMAAMQKASDLNTRRAALWRREGIPYAVDITSRDYNLVNKVKTELEEDGYDVYMVFVNTSLETAMARNSRRQRKADDSYLQKAWQMAQSLVQAYRNLFSGHFLMVNNEGEMPPEKQISLYRMAINALTPNRISNPIGNEKLEKLKNIAPAAV